MSQSITFLGAARTVTGSKHLIQTNGKNILVDCGIFQGSRELKQRNWQPFPIPPSDIDAVVLTHAHMDHIGMLPRLMKDGYSGPIYATHATLGLARISLPDSGRLQEEEARHRNKHGLTRHQPALPLYTEQDAYQVLKQLQPVHYHQFKELPGGATWQYLPAGHILGSAFAEIYFDNGERIMMSGDLGRYGTPIIKDPTTVEYAEHLVIESTYGDRLHGNEHVSDRLSQIMHDAVKNGSCVIVPSFSIGRTQELLYFINGLQSRKRAPRIPIYLDSPMAVTATELYRSAGVEHDDDMLLAIREGDRPLDPDGLQVVRDREASKALNSQSGPLMIIAGSGMANGGRVVHHLLRRLSNPDTVVLFTGYQAEGTLGRKILDKHSEVQILGRTVAVNARVERLTSLSAHADQGEMMQWLGGFKQAPKRTFIVHGEPSAQEVLASKIQEELGWDVSIPEHGERFDLS